MTNRTFFLLLALASWAAGALLLLAVHSGLGRGDRGNARLIAALLLLSAVGGIYCLVAAFSKRRHRFGYNYDEYTTFSCPTCQAKLDYSVFPAFRDEMPCPHCGQALSRAREGMGGGIQIRFVRSPEVRYEISADNGSPPPGPATAEEVRKALASGSGFTVEDDPGGWLLLTATGGHPRWLDGPTPGSVVAGKQVAWLSLAATGDGGAVLPESLALTSTAGDLTLDVCAALSSALGPLRVRISGADEWIAVRAEEGTLSALGQLALQGLRLRGVCRPS
jgi:hypothetical protein